MKNKLKKVLRFTASWDFCIFYIAAMVLIYAAVSEDFQFPFAEGGSIAAVIFVIIIIEMLVRKQSERDIERRQKSYDASMQRSMDSMKEILDSVSILPLNISREYRILSVQWHSSAVFNCDDNHWEIIGEYNREFFAIYIIRNVAESRIDFINELRKTKQPDDIYVLDCSE